MINIMCAGNVKVLDGMIIICISLSKYCKEAINLFVLTMDLRQQNKDFIPIETSINPSYKLGGFSAFISKHISNFNT